MGAPGSLARGAAEPGEHIRGATWPPGGTWRHPAALHSAVPPPASGVSREAPGGNRGGGRLLPPVSGRACEALTALRGEARRAAQPRPAAASAGPVGSVAPRPRWAAQPARAAQPLEHVRLPPRRGAGRRGGQSRLM